MKPLSEKIDTKTGYRIRKIVNKDGYLFDWGYNEKDIDKKIWVVDHPNFPNKKPLYFKTKKDLDIFLKKIQTVAEMTHHVKIQHGVA